MEVLKFLEGNPGGRVRQVIAAVPNKDSVLGRCGSCANRNTAGSVKSEK